jgi:hypothetical protein
MIFGEALMSDDSADIRRTIIDALISCAEAQLRALRRLRDGAPQEPRRRSARRSTMDTVEDILKAAGQPLHVSEIIRRAHADFSLDLDRESLVSALTKKVHRRERFLRTAPNTFGLKGERS